MREIMTTLEYRHLSYEEKKELLRVNGSFLSEKSNSNKGKLSIYSLYGFFVEVSYNKKNQEKYIRVLSSYFDTESQLEGMWIHLN
jgi:hypothetical protein